MTIEQRKRIVELANLDVIEFGDADSLEALRQAELRLDDAIQKEIMAGKLRLIEASKN